LFTKLGLVEEEYRREIYALIECILCNEILYRDQTEIKHYFEGHFPIFRDGLNLAYTKSQLNANALILEYGSPIPYFSLPFVMEYNCKALCKDIQTRRLIRIKEKIKLDHGNICLDELEPSSFDFIIMTEVWEHLPCSLLETKTKILNALKPGGYLLASFPIKGANSDPNLWDKIIAKDFESEHDHLREFTPKTIN
jgi:SAM-dependent methyltransferase